MEKNDIIEIVKLLSTINSGTVVLTITLLKDLFHSRAFNKIIKAAWTFLIVSTIFSILSVNFLSDESCSNSEFCLGIAIFLNIIGTIFVIVFVMKAIHKDQDASSKRMQISSENSKPPNEDGTSNSPLEQIPHES